MELTDHQREQLDTAQRQAGRAVLGFLQRSPTPAVLLELGWVPWGTMQRVEMTRLMARIACSEHRITQAIADAQSQINGTWLQATAEEIAPWTDDSHLADKAQWKKWIRLMKEELTAAEHDRVRLDARTHHNLRSYQPAWWMQTGEVGYNRTFQKCGLRQAVINEIYRLLIGGQGLRGGDPEEVEEPTNLTCCLHCLRDGVKTPETLRHFALECAANEESRKGIAKILHKDAAGIFLICRNKWSWAEIRQITRFFNEVLRIRNKPWRTLEFRTREARIQEEVDSLW